MRIGIFHPSLDMYGGAEVVAVVTANTLAEQGYDVVLLMNRWVDQERVKAMVGEPFHSSIRVTVQSTPLEPRGAFHLYESAFRSLAFKSGCDLLVDTYSCCVFPWIDVSYMHFPYLNNLDFKPNFPYLKGAPHLYKVVTVPYAVFEKNLENYGEKLLLANSCFTARALKESLGVNSEVLYPPIPDALFSKVNADTDYRPREDLVVTVARFGQGKDVELVPEIANLTDKNVKFVMIGLAHDWNVVHAVKNRLRKLGITDRVTVTTNASRQEIKSYLSIAKVYLHTKKIEHFGISIAEGMALGCLPVVHDSGGAPEFVPDHYRYRNIGEAARMVNLAVQGWTPRESEKMRRAAEHFSERNFSLRFVNLFTDYCASLKKL